MKTKLNGNGLYLDDWAFNCQNYSFEKNCKVFYFFSFTYVTPCVLILCHIVDNLLFFSCQVYFVFIVLWFIGNCKLLLCIVIKYMYYGTGSHLTTHTPVSRIETVQFFPFYANNGPIKI